MTTDSNHVYLAIDLKSFYASVECVDRGLDPLTENLVVADITRTEKTICLAVSPSLKKLGISGRARLFEVMEQAQNIDITIAPPRMARYVEVSSKVFEIYGKFVSPEDIHVYSVDEAFLDITHYLEMYHQTPRELAMTIIKKVLQETGITATAGIGTNLYLAKIAMDIEAKHQEADENGVRIAELDEKTYREKLWDHQPLTDFWRIGKGISRRLNNLGIHSMGELARYSLTGSDKLYKTFGINAELIIDHAWGWEPVSMQDIKTYEAASHSLSSGQVLKAPYSNSQARIVLNEMADQLALDLFSKQLFTDQIVLTICYEKDTQIHGTKNIDRMTASAKLICQKALELYDEITEKDKMIRRIYLVFNHLTYNRESKKQLEIFRNYEAEEEQELKNQRLQAAALKIRKKYGKNAIIKAISLEDCATAIERNNQIGGHRA